MAEGGDKDDKTEAPTARRLDEARKRGEIVYSQEAATWIMLATGAGALMTLGGPMAKTLANLLVGFLSSASTLPTDGDSLQHLYLELGLRVGGAVGMFMLALMVAAFVARLIQDQPTWAPSRLSMDLSKLDPVKGFGRVFGAGAWGNFGKAALKLTIVGGAALWALWPRDAVLETESTRDLLSFWPLVQERATNLVGAILAAFALIAVLDYVTTRHSYMQKMRMSRHEMKEEFRQQEGDPHVRAKLRQIRNERSRQRMMTKVPEATVVITNPTHYAVALKYDSSTPAPICVAKGVEDVALRIRELARDSEIPIVEDPPLARALYASAELDAAIPREHYEAVAKVIGVVMRLAARKRTRRGPVNPNRTT
jgi:flagellar biosynthetic protein FlhB